MTKHHEAGKGPGRREGQNDPAYRGRYPDIYGPRCPIHSMRTLPCVRCKSIAELRKGKK